MILETRIMRQIDVQPWRSGGVRIRYQSAHLTLAQTLPTLIDIELDNKQANDLVKMIREALCAK